MPRATAATIDPLEAAHFGKLAREWWDPTGSSAMLHRLNPVRLRYIREQADAHWGLEPASFTPFKGKRALDVGCGAGLLCEPLERLGAETTGIDAAIPNIDEACRHANLMRLPIDYRASELSTLAGEEYDLVTSMEVIEHVADVAAFVRGLVDAMAEDGLLILSTPNRTALSRLALIAIGEGTGRIPRGTHDWSKFLTPDELTTLLEAAGLRVIDVRGLAFSPSRGFELSDSTALDYFVTAVRA